MSNPDSTALAEVAAPEILKLDPDQYTTAVFQPYRSQLEAIKAEGAAVTFEIETAAGMGVAVAWRRKFRELRVEAEKARKERKAPVLEIGRLLDSKAKAFEAEILPLESRFDDAIKIEEARKEQERQAAEARERARVELIQSRIANDIRGAVSGALGGGSEQISRVIADVVAIDIDIAQFADFAGQAQLAKDETLAKLREMLTAAIAREEQAVREKAEREAEAARLKAEREELARQRAAQAEIERAAALERVKAEAAAKAQREAEEVRLRADRAAFEAEQRAAREEIERQQAEVDRVRREQEAAAEAARQVEVRKQREAENLAKAQERAERDRQAQIRAQRRPSDDQLIEAVRKAFAKLKPADAEVIQWLSSFDADDALARRALEAA